MEGLEAFGGVGDVVHLGHVLHKLIPNPVGEFEIGGVFGFGQRVALGDGKVEQEALFLKPGQHVFDLRLGDFHVGNHPAALQNLAAVGRVERGER